MILCRSAMTLLDSEQSDLDDTSNNKPPLPCPCSEYNLENHSSHSHCYLLQLKEECEPSQTSASSQLSTSNDEQHLCRHAARQVVKGVFAGSVLSLLFVAAVVLLAPKSAVRWVGSMNHRIKTVTFPLITETGVTWRQKLKQVNQSSSSNKSVSLQRQLRDSRQTENEISHNSTKLEGMYQPPTPLAMKKSFLHDVTLDGQLVQEFFHRPRNQRVYHAHDTTPSIDTIHKILQRPSRLLQSSTSYANSDPSSSSSDTNLSPSDSAVPNTPPKDPQLVVAGKLTVADGPCNVAQMNLKTGEWSLQQRIQLSLYNSYSGGEVYSLLANHTFTTNSNAKEFRAEETSSKGRSVHFFSAGSNRRCQDFTDFCSCPFLFKSKVSIGRMSWIQYLETNSLW